MLTNVITLGIYFRYIKARILLGVFSISVGFVILHFKFKLCTRNKVYGLGELTRTCLVRKLVHNLGNKFILNQKAKLYRSVLF